MKKSILLLAAALPFALSAKDVKITRPAASLDNDTLTLSFRFNVEEVKVNSEQSYTFTPVLVNGNEHLVLAPMAVSGKKNYKMPRKIRRAGRKFGFSEPYTVVYGKAADRNDIIDIQLHSRMKTGWDQLVWLCCRKKMNVIVPPRWIFRSWNISRSFLPCLQRMRYVSPACRWFLT